MSRLIISFYDTFRAANNAIKELIEKGFCDESISLVALRAVCERTWDFDRANSWFFRCQPSSMQLAGIGPVLVSGFLATDLHMAEVGKKSLARALEKRLVPEVDASAYSEGVRRKGILVLVKAERTNSSRALSVLDKHCPVDMQDLENQWRKAGWTGFDDTARPLQSNGINWPSCITSLPGDELLVDGVQKNWPQSIVGRREDGLKNDKSNQQN